MDNAAPLYDKASVEAATEGSIGRTELNGGYSDTKADGVRIIIPSNTEFVRVVRLAVLGVASRMAFTFEDIEDIKLAISEACNNAILHAKSASHPARSSPVEITVTPYPDRIEIEVADGGFVPPPGLQPREAHRPATLESNELRESGLGLFLMQTLMDEIEHKTSAESSTIVRMVKFLPESAPARTGRPATSTDSSAESHEPGQKAGSSAAI